MVKENKDDSPLGDVPSYYNRVGSCQGGCTKRCVSRIFSIRCAQSIIAELNLETHRRFEVAEGTDFDMVQRHID
jgi:hypothetical protein